MSQTMIQMSQTMFKPIHTAPINGQFKASLNRTLSFPIARGRCCVHVKSSPSFVVKGQQGAVCGVGVLERTDTALELLERKREMIEFQAKATRCLKSTCQKLLEFAVGGSFDGGGGDDGNNDNRGRGGGNRDDDDDYRSDDDDDDDGDRDDDDPIDEIFDRKSVDAILKEWQKTIMDLPPALRQAYEMGMVSSAELVKFLAMSKVTPTTKLVSMLPRGLRVSLGRMIADPALFHRLFLEQIFITCCSISWEVIQRGNRIKKEWDLALINVRRASVCNAIVFAGSMLTLVHGKSSNHPAAQLIRHRLIRGLNKSSVNYFDVVRMTLIFSMGFRMLNACIGRKSRPVYLVRSDCYPQTRTSN